MKKSDAEKAALDTLVKWYEGERPSADREPERYVVCAGLAITELFRDTFPLKESDYLTDKNQIKKTGGPSIKSILERFGETREYAREGGRTTRGTRPAAERLVKALNRIEAFADLTLEERHEIMDSLQRWLVDRVREYFNRKKIEVEIALDKSGQQIVANILAAAAAKGVAGAVAQHIVGAKLALRYPHLDIENYSYTTADVQLGRPGDFVVGDTVFHVTVSPMPAVINKCELNLRNNYRVILLVADSRLQAARQMAEMEGIADRIGLYSIEAFVGQNVEEICEFGRGNLARGWKTLLEKYNERVLAVETDRSLLIDIPANLQ
ncbi:MAG: hypothetical protein BAA01_06565 [Bacillus thermozeamaize]|uniref:DUF4928 domain-containing protein n=1 Tax=Bacillus thermozeamaize TaxID=230954 RepID=A0A1Y3PJL3_9BACI|nr:MAG: hypothetical protein BAA01_06565 [Bacillus thermozeamaize]